MKQLKILMFILLAITIGSCYSIESDCDSCNNVIEDAFWERVRGSEVLVPITALSITVSSNGDIWVGTYAAPYLSTNNGVTWIKKDKGFSLYDGAPCIAINPINGYIFAGGSNGLYRSTDRGESWVKVIRNRFVLDILITTSGEIYFGIHNETVMSKPVKGVYYSNNNGNTWVEKSNGLPYDPVESLALGKDGILYAGTGNKGIYSSTDGGDSWLLSSNDSNVIVRKLTVSDNGSIFAACINGVLKFTDRDDTLAEIVTLPNADINAIDIIYNTITKDIFVLCHGYNNAHNQIYKSTDLGASWKLTNSGVPNVVYVNKLTFNPNTGQMYLLTSNGLYRSKM